MPSSPHPVPVRPVVGVLTHLDGLRGIAVLLVLLYHARVGLAGGYVGVDVFLVLSGFLVTSLLLREHDGGRVSLREFWCRRIRRLLPLSALVTVVTAFVGLVVLEPQRLARLPGDVFGVATFSANVRFFETHGDYLGGLSLPSPVLHFWSLALEEQFYLAWPVLLVAVLALSSRARAPERVLVVVTAVFAAASFCSSLVLTASRPAFSYYLLPARAWELLAGALLALCWSPLTLHVHGPSAVGAVRSVLGSCGLVLVVVVAFVFDEETVFPGWAAALPVLGTLAVLAAGGSSVSGRLLAAPALRWLGVRSYGAYLWHWPLLVFAGALGWDRSAWSRLAVLPLALFLADLSFRGLESPLRSSSWLRISSARTALVGGAFSIVLLLVALGVDDLVAGRTATIAAPTQRLPEVRADLPVVLPPSTSGTAVPGTSVPVLGASGILLLGDSTLAPLRWFVDGSAGLDAWSPPSTFVIDAESCRRLSRRPCVGREGRRPPSAVEALEARLGDGERYRFVVLMVGYHSTPDEFADELDAFMASASSGGVETVFVPEYRESLAFPLDGSGGTVSVFAGFNDVLRSRAALPPEGSRVRLVALPWNSFTAAAGDWFRTDGIHVNLAGALGLGEFLARGVLSGLGLPCGSYGVCPAPAATAAPAGDVLLRYALTATDEHCYEVGERRARECRPDPLR